MAALFIFILKIIKLSNSILKTLGVDNKEVVKENVSRFNKIVKTLSKSKKLKNNKSKILTYIQNIKAIKKIIFFILYTNVMPWSCDPNFMSIVT